MQAKQLKSDPSLAFDTQCICHYQTCLRVEPGDIHPFYSLELLLLRQNGSNEYQSTRSLNFRWTCNYERKKKERGGDFVFLADFFYSLLSVCFCLSLCFFIYTSSISFISSSDSFLFLYVYFIQNGLCFQLRLHTAIWEI